jgi:hypothetical protein
MTIDELLCKFQGLHWHEGVTYPDGTQSRYKCSCMEHQSIDPLSSLNPDFSDDHTAMELLRWMHKTKWRMWRAFRDYSYGKMVESELMDFQFWSFSFTQADGKQYMIWVSTLAEWLRLPETIRDFGWEECPNCEQGYAIRKVGHRMEGTTDRCQFCDGSGKVLSAWAKYAKEG